MKNLLVSLKYLILLEILSLSLSPAKAQDSELKMRAGITYTSLETKDISKRSFMGIESLIEKEITDRISIEMEAGMYSALIKGDYSRMQTNVGIKYKPVDWGNWNIGIKAAIGCSSEFYLPENGNLHDALKKSEKVSMSNPIELQIEKRFKNKRSINMGISREVDKKIWKVGIKTTLKNKN